MSEQSLAKIYADLVSLTKDVEAMNKAADALLRQQEDVSRELRECKAIMDENTNSVREIISIERALAAQQSYEASARYEEASTEPYRGQGGPAPRR